MSADRKVSNDSDRFYDAYIVGRRHKIRTKHELSFLLGYYAHLVTDAEFQRYIRDTARVASSWERIKEHPVLSDSAKGMP